MVKKKEIGKFLKIYKLPGLNHNEIKNMNRFLLVKTSKEIESVIRCLSKSKAQKQVVHWRILPNIEKEFTPILLKLFRKIEKEETLPNSLYEVTITLVSKSMIQQEKKKAEKLKPSHSFQRYRGNQQ